MKYENENGILEFDGDFVPNLDQSISFNSTRLIQYKDFPKFNILNSD